MSDCKFYVDETARTVVCVIPNTRFLVLEFIQDNFRYTDIDFDFATEPFLRTQLNMPRSFMGKAVCAKEDEWNEETGKMIAFSRAKDKCYKSFFKRANNFIQTIDSRLGEMISTFNDFGLKLENRREALQTKINERVQ